MGMRTFRSDGAIIGDVEVPDQPGRNGPAAGLDAALAIQQQDGTALLGEMARRRGPGRSAAHNDAVKGFGDNAEFRPGHDGLQKGPDERQALRSGTR
jgi:hypothetical protein